MLIFVPMNMDQISKGILQCDFKTIARAISLIENKVDGHEMILQMLPAGNAPIIGITGPPGAGKSTITDLLIECLAGDGKKIAVLCVDPSSPFHFGALLGDRVRMSNWYNHPNVFIRSLASRGSLGGLSPQVIGISDLLKAAGFDYVIVETVGVGQIEVEIAGLADTTVVVLVPESGDEIQTMKAGLMEIADIFVVNKCDRPGADLFSKNLQQLLMHDPESRTEKTPVIKTIASEKQGIMELTDAILQHIQRDNKQQKILLLIEKAYQLIINKRMQSINKKELREKIENGLLQKEFNLYKLVAGY